MRYVSEAFKEIQSEVIRPATKLYFEIGTDVGNSIRAENPEFDTDVAPIVTPLSCANEHYYAIMGDGQGVDDPNRICAPDDPAVLPNTSVPYGVTTIHGAGSPDIIIGNTTEFYYNFVLGEYPVALNFKGYVPDTIKVERYDLESDAWVEETVINNPELKENVKFTPSEAGSFYRFGVNRSGFSSGRFILNYIKELRTEGDGVTPVIFEDTHISSVSISQETDLTSQTLPSYEFSVECLDVDEEYTPDTDYWKNLFVDGTPCFFKAGYEIGGSVEYIPIAYGKLTQAPTYNAGKLTFKVAFNWHIEWDIDLNSIVDNPPAAGEKVEGRTFKDIIEQNIQYSLNPFFNRYDDVFADQDDIDNSECNYYGELDTANARQMVANALGGFILPDVNAVNLHNANNIQYKTFIDYLTRYEQVQNTLESQPKVGKISVARYENTLASDYMQVTLPERIYVSTDNYGEGVFTIPSFAFGNWVVTNWDKSVSTANVTITDFYEEVNEDGTVSVHMTFATDANTYIKPTIRFYNVNSKRFSETEVTEDVKGEEYINDNELVTNSYVASKVKRVAHLINDVSNQYEVDMIQDLRYEPGDVIRLETQKDIFKTCVITGVRFTFPGSNGHITCRKIFALEDTPEAVQGARGLVITSGDEIKVTVLEADNDICVVGDVYMPDDPYLRHAIVLGGVTKYEYEEAGTTPTIFTPKVIITDRNGHRWHASVFIGYYTPITNAEVIELPPYLNSSTPNNVSAYAAMSLIMKMYENQGMTSPVDYGCDYEIIP